MFLYFGLRLQPIPYVKIINELKTKHLLPNSIVHNYPDIAKLVLNMTDPDAHKRPTAEDVSSSSIFEQLKKETSTK